MDLKEFYFQNIQEAEYHYRFHDSIKNVNRIYNIFSGYEEVDDYEFEVYDAEEAITKFRELCQPEVSFSSSEKKCWFYLITYYLYKMGYEIKEFPRVLARPPVDPSDFTYGEIRNRIIAQGDDDNGTVRYAVRRKMHCFRHATDEAIAERNSYSEEQKNFFVDYGLTIVKVIHSLLK